MTASGGRHGYAGAPLAPPCVARGFAPTGGLPPSPLPVAQGAGFLLAFTLGARGGGGGPSPQCVPPPPGNTQAGGRGTLRNPNQTSEDGAAPPPLSSLTLHLPICRTKLVVRTHLRRRPFF
jgi:hypothetical protein